MGRELFQVKVVQNGFYRFVRIFCIRMKCSDVSVIYGLHCFLTIFWTTHFFCSDFWQHSGSPDWAVHLGPAISLCHHKPEMRNWPGGRGVAVEEGSWSLLGLSGSSGWAVSQGNYMERFPVLPSAVNLHKAQWSTLFTLRTSSCGDWKQISFWPWTRTKHLFF